MAAALQIWSPTFSKAFDGLPSGIRETVQRKIDEMGTRLEHFPHKRLQDRPEFKLRVGDYRVLYEWGDGSVTTCKNVSSLAVGTSGQGEIDCSYSLLLALFGEPEEGDGYKTQAEWTIATPAGIATVYDWKQGDSYHGEGNGTPVEQITQWSVGGHNKAVIEWINKAIKS